MACAKGLYDRFSYFSFYSKPSEEVDANAAHTICDALGLSHVIHAIPSSNEEVEDFAVLKAIVDLYIRSAEPVGSKTIAALPGKHGEMQRDAWYSSMRDARQLATPEAVDRWAEQLTEFIMEQQDAADEDDEPEPEPEPAPRRGRATKAAAKKPAASGRRRSARAAVDEDDDLDDIDIDEV